MLAPSLFRPHRAAVEVGVLVALYAVYEALRGAREASLALARDHTATSSAIERGLPSSTSGRCRTGRTAFPISRRCSASPT